MSDNYNKNEDDLVEVMEPDTQEEQKDQKLQYDRFCFLCHRAESKVGKLIDLPQNIHICSDCMQKSFDTMNTQFSNGNMNLSDLMNMPGVNVITPGNFMNMVQEPKNVKIRKKEKKKDAQPVLDLRKIPAPHKIKATLDE